MVPSKILPIKDFSTAKDLKILFTDIDGTLTHNGRLPSESYEALWSLHKNKIAVVPVTGRPAGWCEMIARMWPVHSVVGENGGFYFSYQNKMMIRKFAIDPDQRKANSHRLEKIFYEIKKLYPHVAPATDQFCRLCDFAVDFCEDIDPPLSVDDAQAIQKIFENFGCTAKVSSIHVNGWFGNYDKLSMCQKLAHDLFQMNLSEHQNNICFVGDSPNDEPMFQFFENSFAVANINSFLTQIQYRPKYIAQAKEGFGFVEIANHLLLTRL